MQRSCAFQIPPRLQSVFRYFVLTIVSISSPPPVNAEPTTPAATVFASERAFAKSMADRSLSAFAGYISDEAIFFGGAKPLRGRVQIIKGWAAYFVGSEPPFSWEPDQVEVLDSGNLALSTGPVRDPNGKVIARFNTIWRLESTGEWRVVFDKGSPASPGPQ
jgi:ketosteroid isomerase-like protein